MFSEPRERLVHNYCLSQQIYAAAFSQVLADPADWLCVLGWWAAGPVSV